MTGDQKKQKTQRSRSGQVRKRADKADHFINTQEHPGLAARLCAARLLGAVIEKHTSLDGLTDNNHGHPQYLALEERDRSLVRAMLGTALRNRGTIETTLARYFERPLPENAVALRQLLHISAAQILYLDVPDHAAVDLAVTAANLDPRNRKFAGLVNAVLRRMSRSKERILANPAPLAKNIPEWLYQRFVQAYGEEATQEILALQALEAPIDLTVKSDPQGWAEKLGGIVMPNGSVRLASLSSSLTQLEGFDDGEWWVQDAAASLPAKLLGDVKGKNIADLCAAPGGKTAQITANGANVTAFDISPNRIKRLKANFARLKLNVTAKQADLMKYTPDEPFDAVLLDAPCSSTGTIRRHPDVAWTKTPQDIEKLAKLQADLLVRSVFFVKPGGVIVFSNCSLDPKEGEEMARAALKNPQLEAYPITPEECEGFAEFITEEGFLRTTPAAYPNDNAQIAGLDGFFAARFRKRA